MRAFHGKAAAAVGVLYVAFVGWSLYGAVVPLRPTSSAWSTWGLFLPWLFWSILPPEKPGQWGRALDVFLAALGVATIVYALYDLDKFIRRSTLPDPADFFMGVVAILLLIEISRRMVGSTFTFVLIGFLLYTYFGNYIPGPFRTKATTWISTSATCT